MHWERMREINVEAERAGRTIEAVGCARARGIKRETKRENAAKKAQQHAANLALRREMNRDAHKSGGRRPRPYPGMRA